MSFCILVHDYNLCFNGSPCYNVGYYSDNSIWPYYIVIHLKSWGKWLKLIINGKVYSHGPREIPWLLITKKNPDFSQKLLFLGFPATLFLLVSGI